MNIKLDNKVDLRAFCLEQAVNLALTERNTEQVIADAKAFEKYILDGQNIPEQNFSTEKLLYETLCGTLKAMNNGPQKDLSTKATMDDKEKKLYELYLKNRMNEVEVPQGKFYICGYSKEFDCLIGGSFKDKTDTKISTDDTILFPYTYYVYIPKNCVDK